MKKSKYIVGDKVIVNDYDWYTQKKDCYGTVLSDNYSCSFDRDMTGYLNKIVTIAEVFEREGDMCYHIEEDNYFDVWGDFMFKGLAPQSMNEELKIRYKGEIYKFNAEKAIELGLIIKE